MFIVLFFTSCQTTIQNTTVSRSIQLQQSIDLMIAKDTENKKWARIYLYEIDQAMLNDDIESYVFFVREFEQIDLYTIPEHLKNELNYVEGPSDLELYFRLRWWEQAIQLYKTHYMKQ